MNSAIVCLGFGEVKKIRVFFGFRLVCFYSSIAVPVDQFVILKAASRRIAEAGR